MPRSSTVTTVWSLNNVTGQQELTARGPSAMLPLSPQLKDVFDKFKQDFQAANLPENISLKPLVPLGVQFRTNYKISKSVSPLIPLGPLWARSPTGSQRV